MYRIGDKVVYPMHGAAVIEKIEEKEILGEKKDYYVLFFPVGGMKAMIPVEKVDDIGLREVISAQEVEKVMDILNDSTTSMPANWNKRFRANMDRIKSGDIYEVAGVVRNLMIRDRDKGLSTAERKMLNNARQILTSELVLTKEAEEKDIVDLIDNVMIEKSV